MLEGVLLYLVMLAVYVPWLIYAVRNHRILQYPVISFTFLGMFFFNAVGSVFVMFPDLFDREDYYTLDFVVMVIAQAVIFYLITGLYFARVSRDRRPATVAWDPGIDRIFPIALLAVMAAIVVLYMSDAGAPPMIEILHGNLDETNIVGYRMQATYDLQGYYLYNLGFATFPLLLATQAFALALARRLERVWAYLLIAIAIAFSSLPGGKGSTLDVITALVVTYLLWCAGYTGTGIRPIAWRRMLFFVVAAFVPVVAMFKVYYGSETSVGSIVQSILYRVFGVYGETMAASIIYVRNYGLLKGAAFPTLHGLLSHEQLNLGQEMHFFLFRSLGGVSVPAPAEGYLNFGWPGFLVMTVVSIVVVVAIQEVFRRLRPNLLFFSVLVLCILFATKLAQMTLFATFVSLTYTAAIVFLHVLRTGIAIVLNRPARSGYALERR